MEYFENLDVLLKTFWFIALPSSAIFIIQTILTFIGLDSGDGTEVDFDGDFDGSDTPFQLFSLRNLINFLLGFSWTGISFYELIQNEFLLISIATFVGLLFVYLFFLIIQQVLKLAENNTFKIESTLNQIGEVYLNIPENKSGKGKILISIKGSTHELEAITTQEKIPSNSLVKVTGIESGNLLIVEKI